jgi:hypothetical protein
VFRHQYRRRGRLLAAVVGWDDVSAEISYRPSYLLSWANLTVGESSQRLMGELDVRKALLATTAIHEWQLQQEFRAELQQLQPRFLALRRRRRRRALEQAVREARVRERTAIERLKALEGEGSAP